MTKNIKHSLVLLFIAFAVMPPFAFAQRQEIIFDSLNKQLKIVNDSVKLILLQQLANGYVHSNQEAMRYAEQGLKLSEKNGYKKGRLIFLHTIANIYINEGYYSKALEFYLKEVRVIEEYKLNPRSMSSAYFGIGNVYCTQNNSDKALEYYHKGLDILKVLVNKYDTQLIPYYNQIGSIYSIQHKYKEALACFAYVVEILEKGKHKEPLYEFGCAYDNIGDVYIDQKDYDKALEYYNKALRNFEGIKMKERIGMACNNRGNVYIQKKQYAKSIFYFEQAVKIITGTMSNEVMQQSYLGLSQAYSGENNFKKAYQFHIKYSDIKDSLLNQASQKQMNDLQTYFESETKDKELIKKDAEIEKNKLEIDLARNESKKQRMVIVFVALALGLVLIIAVVVFRSLRITKKQKQIIEIKSKETEEQKRIIEEKQKEILDSIRYAKRIQQSLLPTETYLTRILNKLKT